jgi:ribonucleoside-diphosphate reductase alpha chain
MSAPANFSPLAELVWRSKYRQRDASGMWDESLADTWARVARALAQAERDAFVWEWRFLGVLEDFRFLPGGRILAGAGTGRAVTLFNCFVMGALDDALPKLFRALEEGALTMRAGGGVGYDFSGLHPAGTDAATGTAMPGPVAYLHVWQSMCAALTAGTQRRGAMMATLRCDHPDIEAFIDAKRDPAALRHFNLSVLVSDAFMRAVQEDRAWPLHFGGVPTQQTLPARKLWRRLARAAYDSAEPGVIFVDQINRWNNLDYRETISATNPCGEVPLPVYGACDLGSVNLTRFVRDPFTPRAHLDVSGIEQCTQTAVRMLDNVYDVSPFPLPQQAQAARASRRLGIGITGLADALAMLGLRYDAQAARTLAAQTMQTICAAAYEASVALASEKGSFPAFVGEAFAAQPFIQQLPPQLRSDIARYGLRNSHLLAIAPAGSISLLAGNVSSGLEPIFAARYNRTVRIAARQDALEVEDYACHLFHALHPGQPLPQACLTLDQISPRAQLEMQAALQHHVDNAISKTVSVPQAIAFDDFADLYRIAYELGLKGCTVFRPNSPRGQVLSAVGCNGASVQACEAQG